MKDLLGRGGGHYGVRKRFDQEACLCGVGKFTSRGKNVGWGGQGQGRRKLHLE